MQRVLQITEFRPRFRNKGCPNFSLRLVILSVLILLNFFFVLEAGAKAAVEVPRNSILILNSYHPGNTWADAEQAGVLAVLKRLNPSVEIHAEYLDTLRNVGPVQLEKNASYLMEKYAGRNFPVLIALDQNALDLLVSRHRDLFPQAVVAFCGVEHIPVLADGSRRWFTGVVENADPVGVVEMAQQLQPNLSRVLVLEGSVIPTQQIRQTLQDGLRGRNPRISVDILPNASLSQLLQSVERLSSDTAIVLTGSSKVMEIQQSLSEHSGAPIYGIQSPNHVGVTVGGVMSDGTRQGEMAAELAIRLLKGEEPSSIPIVSDPPMRRVVDYRQLSRFGLDRKLAPSNVEWINLPPSIWQEHRLVILAASAAFGFLVVLNAVLFTLIRQKRAAQHHLKTSEARLSLLMDNSQDVVVEADQDGCVLFCSSNLERLFGHSADRILGRPIFDLVDADPAEELRKVFRDPEGKSTFRFKHKDGRWIWGEASRRWFQLEGGAEHLVMVIRDVTDRVTEQAEIKKLEESLGQARKLEALGTLSGGIAHDFNNLLTAIIGNVEFLKEDLKDSGSCLESIAEIETAATRGAQLVKQVLSFSRAQSPQRVAVPVKPMLQEVLSVLQRRMPKSIQTRVAGANVHAAVLGDPTQLHQVFLNLCTNAVQAMAEKGGVLEIHASQLDVDEVFCHAHPGLGLGAHARISVRDSGPGIDEATIARIFEPFFTTKPPGSGTGLGLAVVHGIVTGHKGCIIVESKVGAGTKFDVVLPAASVELQAVVASESSLKSGKGQRILLVDDDPQVLKASHRILVSLGYAPESFASPLEALAAFKTRPDEFAIVLTDLSMPDMNGAALLKELIKVRKDVPVLLATGFSGEIDELEAERLGFRALLRKPFGGPLLSSSLTRALSKAP